MNFFDNIAPIFSHAVASRLQDRMTVALRALPDSFGKAAVSVRFAPDKTWPSALVEPIDVSVEFDIEEVNQHFEKVVDVGKELGDKLVDALFKRMDQKQNA